MTERRQTLGARLGMTLHRSPLRFKLCRLMQRHPDADVSHLEDWLVDIANQRGARVVERPSGVDASIPIPSESELPNEELVVAICQLQSLDRPQMLRLAAQMISRNAVDVPVLLLAAKRERAEVVLAELARLALRIEPMHRLWRHIAQALEQVPPPPESLLHWSRLAEPIPRNGLCTGRDWKLVA